VPTALSSKSPPEAPALSSPILSLDEAARSDWDAVVVGAGLSGATLGYALARGGKRVLFCEKGKALLDPASGLRGAFAETFLGKGVQDPAKRETLLQAGRFADSISDLSGGRPRRFIPFVGCGAGGSSALYGAAMERLFPEDFEPRRHYPDAGDSSLPERWPISYGDLLPYYRTAEQLFGVRGTGDPKRDPSDRPDLLPPPPLCGATSRIREALETQGMHSYRLPQACEFVPGCQGCQGFLCHRSCKNDSVRVCLLPAMERYGARLIEDCDVTQLEADAHAVTGVECRSNGRSARIRSDMVVLAAGALETPRILLDSVTAVWPHGLANESGLVGRNLMRHFVDLYPVAPGSSAGHPGNLKELAFNDFYLGDEGKFGTVQSFGSLPPDRVIADELESDLVAAGRRWSVPLFRLGKPALRLVLRRLLSRRVIFASIMEDLPYLDNRVYLAAGGDALPHALNLSYQIRPEGRRRIRQLRKKVRKAFSPRRVGLIKQAENNGRIAHACGTARFGEDPRDSVLDPHNRAHGVENLYVVDASFMPSSGGTNPALTLAANALRVADLILAGTARGPGDPGGSSRPGQEHGKA
jgi:choline dehydrogenase-like flavoprotein